MAPDFDPKARTRRKKRQRDASSFFFSSVPAQVVSGDSTRPVSAPFLGPRETFSRQENAAAGTVLVDKPHTHQNRLQKVWLRQKQRARTRTRPSSMRSIALEISKKKKKKNSLSHSHLHKLPSEVHGHERVGCQDAWGQGRQEQGGDGRQQELAKPKRERHFFFFFFSSSQTSEGCVFCFVPSLNSFFFSRRSIHTRSNSSLLLPPLSFDDCVCFHPKKGSGITQGAPFKRKRRGGDAKSLKTLFPLRRRRRSAFLLFSLLFPPLLRPLLDPQHKNMQKKSSLWTGVEPASSPICCQRRPERERERKRQVSFPTLSSRPRR